MIQLIVNSEVLDLNENTSIDLELSSIMQEFKLKGSFTMPFQLPCTSKNLRILEFFNVLAVAKKKNKSYSATLFDDSILVADGQLNIRSGTKKYLDCDITIPPGNIPLYFWQTKMNEMDWGSEMLPSKKHTPNVWATAIPKNEITYFGVVSTATQIYNYNVIVNGSQIFTMQNVVSVEADALLKVRCEELTGVFNTSNLPYKISSNDEGISLEGAGITSARIDVVVTGITPDTKSYVMNQLSEVDIIDFEALSNLAVNNFLGKNWRLGQINYDIEKGLYVNTGFEMYFSDPNLVIPFTDRLNVCPSPKMTWVFQKFAEMVGFSIEGNFFSRPDFQELCFYNAYALKTIHQVTYANHYVSTPTIEYKYMMPEWTFEEFVSELAKTINIEVDIDTFERKISINLTEFFEYQQSIPIDLSDDYVIRSSNAKKVLLKYEADKNDTYSEANLNKERFGTFDNLYGGYVIQGDTLLESYPPKSVVESSKIEYDEITSKMMPVRIREFSRYDIATSTFSTYRTPICGLEPKEKGNNSVRLFFYIEKTTIDYRIPFVVSLAWDELVIGLLKFWKNKINSIENGYELEQKVALTIPEGIQLMRDKKAYIDGVTFKVKQANLKLPIKDTSKVVFIFQ